MTLTNKQLNASLCLLIISLFLGSCFLSKKELNSDVPELLTRSEKIRMDKEWDYVQNAYQNLSLQIKDKDKKAPLVMAQLFIQEARITGEHGHYYPAALQMLDLILTDQNPDKDLLFMTLVTKAGVELSLHDFQKALETGLKAHELNSQNAQVHGVLVDAYVELGDYEKAISHADKMVSIKPDIRSYSRISYLRQLHGDMSGAMDAMKMAVEAGLPGREDSAWAALTYGELLAEQGKYDEALSVYESILEVRPDYPFAINAIGEIYHAQDQLEMAESKYREAISIIPEVGFYINLAKICKAQERLDELASLKSEIKAMLADDIQHGHNMNLELAQLHLDVFPDYQLAEKIALEEYSFRPDNIHVNQLLSEIYMANGQWQKAQEHFEKAALLGTHSREIIALQENISNHISN